MNKFNKMGGCVRRLGVLRDAQSKDALTIWAGEFCENDGCKSKPVLLMLILGIATQVLLPLVIITYKR